MKPLFIAMAVISTLTFTVTSFSAGLTPWDFGMSKSEVTAFKEFGPYRTFSNGDIETFNGIYDGKKENIQFFFDATGLYRIGVYVYEGQDIQASRAAWRRTYDSLAKNYGKVDTPDIKVAQGSDPANSEVLSIAAAANVDLFGKTQMAPVIQPEDMSIISTFTRQEVQGVRHFYVIVYFGRRPLQRHDQEAICRITECRISYDMFARVAPDRYYKGTWRLAPYFNEGTGTVLIGETLHFDVLVAKDNSVSLRRTEKEGPETLDVQLFQPGNSPADIMTMANLKNNSPFNLRYKGTIFPVAANRLVPTSVCGLVAGRVVSENWPYAVLAFTFGSFSVTTKEEAPACRE